MYRHRLTCNGTHKIGFVITNSHTLHKSLKASILPELLFWTTDVAMFCRALVASTIADITSSSSCDSGTPHWNKASNHCPISSSVSAAKYHVRRGVLIFKHDLFFVSQY